MKSAKMGRMKGKTLSKIVAPGPGAVNAKIGRAGWRNVAQRKAGPNFFKLPLDKPGQN
jgi:RNA:NAD 2'-phosphotransferase (TPT1/KptA family)